MASRNVILISSTKFPLEKAIVAPGGSATVDIGASTSHDLLDAILAQTRLPEAGDDGDASFFTAQQAGSFQNMARSGMGDTLLRSLLFSEAEIIRGATAVLKDVNEMLDAVAVAPTKAITRFADFGTDLTDIFHHKLSSVYGDDATAPSLGWC